MTLRKPETVAFWVGRLPHWEVVDGRYFVTIHLAGAIPPAGQQRIREIVARLDRVNHRQHQERLRLQRHIFAEMEAWLDRAEQVALLRQPAVAQRVVEAIRYRSQQGVWQMFEYVVMPSHVHLFFALLRGGLKQVLEDFKGWTGRQAGKLLHLDGDRFWQKEWFDHWSRSDEEDERIAANIRHNPEKAGLVRRYTDWPHGSWSSESKPADMPK
jgi:hypothetical protein